MSQPAMKSPTRQRRACDAIQQLEAVVTNHSELVASPGFLDSPLLVTGYVETFRPSTSAEQIIPASDLAVTPGFLDSPLVVTAPVETFRPSTPVDQIITEWIATSSNETSSFDSSSASVFSSANTSFGASVTSTPSTSFSSTSSEYEVKHGQYIDFPRKKSTYERDWRTRDESALFSVNVTSVIALKITPSACLQCSILNLQCSETHPTCTRCSRRHAESLGGFYGLIRASEPCLAQRAQVVDESRVLDASHTTTRIMAPNGNADVLFRLPSDGDGDWERKLELANELVKGERERMDRCNWVLPEAPRVVKGFGGWDMEGDQWEYVGHE